MQMSRKWILFLFCFPINIFTATVILHVIMAFLLHVKFILVAVSIIAMLEPNIVTIIINVFPTISLHQASWSQIVSLEMFSQRPPEDRSHSEQSYKY